MFKALLHSNIHEYMYLWIYYADKVLYKENYYVEPILGKLLLTKKMWVDFHII